MDRQYELRLAEAPTPGPGAEPAAATRRRTGRGLPALTGLAEKGLAPKPGTRAIKAKANFLPPEATADEAFRLTLQHCKWHLVANVPAVLDARDVEGVHQLRVALRRLRVALVAFGEEFRTPALETLRIRTQILAQGLAPARDMDVFMDELFEPAAAANGSVEAFSLLRERGRAARAAAWNDALREVSGPAFRSFLHDLGEAIDEGLWYESARGPAHGKCLVAFEGPARSLADRMLAKRLKRARKRAKNLENLSEPDRHRLRIALKKMRYSAEFFASLYPHHNAAPFIKQLGRTQDILGLLQDVAVARKTLTRLVEEPDGSLRGPRADVSFAAGIIYGWHLDRAASAWKDAVKRWKRFSKTAPFWTNS